MDWLCKQILHKQCSLHICFVCFFVALLFGSYSCIVRMKERGIYITHNWKFVSQIHVCLSVNQSVCMLCLAVSFNGSSGLRLPSLELIKDRIFLSSIFFFARLDQLQCSHRKQHDPSRKPQSRKAPKTAVLVTVCRVVWHLHRPRTNKTQNRNW